MPKVLMLETAKGSPDGITVNTYEKGEQYDLPDDLISCFVDSGCIEMVVEETKVEPAEEVEDDAEAEAEEEVIEEATEEAPEENKALDPVEETKVEPKRKRKAKAKKRKKK